MEEYELIESFQRDNYKIEIFAPLKNDEEELKKTLEFLEKLADEINHSP